MVHPGRIFNFCTSLSKDYQEVEEKKREDIKQIIPYTILVLEEKTKGGNQRRQETQPYVFDLSQKGKQVKVRTTLHGYL